MQNLTFRQNQYIYLDEVLTKVIGSDDPSNMINYGPENIYTSRFPTRKI